MIKVKDHLKRYYPPVGISSEPPLLKINFQKVQIPQVSVTGIQLRPNGVRQPREEANLLGQIRWVRQLNGG